VEVLYASTSPLKERYAVSNDNVIKLIQPGTFDDQLTEILRQGAENVAMLPAAGAGYAPCGFTPIVEHRAHPCPLTWPRNSSWTRSQRQTAKTGR
jgi:hypothetical protein